MHICTFSVNNAGFDNNQNIALYVLFVYVYDVGIIRFIVYCRELAPGTVSLTGDRAQGVDSKHDSHYRVRAQ